MFEGVKLEGKYLMIAMSRYEGTTLTNNKIVA